MRLLKERRLRPSVSENKRNIFWYPRWDNLWLNSTSGAIDTGLDRSEVDGDSLLGMSQAVDCICEWWRRMPNYRGEYVVPMPGNLVLLPEEKDSFWLGKMLTKGQTNMESVIEASIFAHAELFDVLIVTTNGKFIRDADASSREKLEIVTKGA